MKTRLSGNLGRAWQKQHEEAFSTSSFLTNVFRQMYQPMAAKVTPKKVVKILRKAGVVGLLLGTHGVGGYRSEARATQDVDMLIKKKDHAKAVRAIKEAFPKLEIRDTPVVTRFIDPYNGKPVIDLMKPTDSLFKMAFRFSLAVGVTHRIPDLELALVTKFAAMVSPNRMEEKKMIDGGDFYNIVRNNLESLDLKKLQALANKVYKGGGKEIADLVENIRAGRKIEF